MSDTTTNTDWAPTSALTIQLGDQIKHNGFWRTVTGRHIVAGNSIDVFVGEHRPVTFKAGTDVMVRTVAMQEQRKADAKSTVDKALDGIEKTVTGWWGRLAGKAGTR